MGLGGGKDEIQIHFKSILIITIWWWKKKIYISPCIGNTRLADHLLPYVYNLWTKYILRPRFRFRRRGVYTRFIVYLKLLSTILNVELWMSTRTVHCCCCLYTIKYFIIIVITYVLQNYRRWPICLVRPSNGITPFGARTKQLLLVGN